ncbi:hypothetical protein FXW78_16685 [Rhodococcus opacus]|nr:hypothetical protein [Rhodococcus opacus]RZL82087.1 MAG: hypothetical protein EOP32_12930 [Rhodococcus sp. (in: high G+C Gram-positive bacteria)]
MRRMRWPAAPPPATEGVVVHGPVELVTSRDVSLRLSEVVAHPTGMLLHIDLTARGRSADLARHETRPLDDPDDPSARWSYLAVNVRVDDVEGVADPHHPHSPSKPDAEGASEYHSAPHYWISDYPESGTITLTVGWKEIGLLPRTRTITLGPNPSMRPAR